MPPKAIMSWSSGKVSAFALYEARRLGLAEITGLLTTVNETYDRVAMHGVRHDLLDRQAAALGLPALKIQIPSPCPNEVYEARMREACATIKAQGIDHIVFGDLFLEDIRRYREEQLSALGMTAIFPLWGRPTRALAEEMVASGLVAHLVCVDPRRLDSSFAGRRFDTDLLRGLPGDVDPCGENGEFHTFVSDAPGFAQAIPIAIGQVVEREGFVFADAVLKGAG